jgi:hypothetical protein
MLPIVDGRRQGRESKAEIIFENGRVVRIEISSVRGRRPLSAPDLNHFQTLIEHFADEIVQKRIDYFVLHKPIEAQMITQRLG